MAVYTCSICGNQQKSVNPSAECDICGGRDFKAVGNESVFTGRAEGNGSAFTGRAAGGQNAATDIGHLFARHNMVFPPVREALDREKMRKFQAEAGQQSQGEVDKLKEKLENRYKGMDRVGTILLIVTILVLVGSCVRCVTWPSSEPPWFWIGLAAADTVVIWLLCINERGFYNRVGTRSEKAEQATLEAGEETIRQFEKRQAEEYSAYCREFERLSQKLSEQYAGTKFVSQVAEWIFEPFARAIAAADREERIQTIRLPYSYGVSTDRITCEGGTYDFRGHGLDKLDDPVCQTALAKALAVALRILTLQRYSADPAGGQTMVSYQIRYEEQRPVVTLLYEAPNGRYNAKSRW